MAAVRIGVIGLGRITQLMHLPHLCELDDRFEVAGVCDASPGLARLMADRYHVPLATADYRDLLRAGLDAVLVAVPVPPEDIVQLLPHPGVPPGVEVVRHRLPRREVVRQAPPLAPGPRQVEDGIDDVLAVVGPLPPGPGLGLWEQVADVMPLKGGQVTRVRLPCAHARRVNSTPAH